MLAATQTLRCCRHACHAAFQFRSRCNTKERQPHIVLTHQDIWTCCPHSCPTSTTHRLHCAYVACQGGHAPPSQALQREYPAGTSDAAVPLHNYSRTAIQQATCMQHTLLASTTMHHLSGLSNTALRQNPAGQTPHDLTWPATQWQQ